MHRSSKEDHASKLRPEKTKTPTPNLAFFPSLHPELPYAIVFTAMKGLLVVTRVSNISEGGFYLRRCGGFGMQLILAAC
jgi:hypothetical protein